MLARSIFDVTLIWSTSSYIMTDRAVIHPPNKLASVTEKLRVQQIEHLLAKVPFVELVDRLEH